MTVYDSILGHKRQIEQLKRVRDGGRVAHAYLFYGPDGVGKELTAFAFTQALNCVGEEAPCGECEHCRKIQRGGHPDVRLVASEEELVARKLTQVEGRKVASRQIRREQLDELADLFRHRPYAGRWKVVLVVDADLMNENSQNRFLKTLEEPSPDSVIILLTSRPEALLPTVRSRCQALAFNSVPREDIVGYLNKEHGIEADAAEVFAAMAQGSLGRALALVEGEVLAVRNQVAEALSGMLDADLEDILGMAQTFGKSRPMALHALEIMEFWCRDLLLLGAGVNAARLVNLDCQTQLSQTAARVGTRSLVRWIEGIRQKRRAMDTNANPRMTMESLFLSMRSC